jgi:hypothetical protein
MSALLHCRPQCTTAVLDHDEVRQDDEQQHRHRAGEDELDRAEAPVV